MASPVRRTGQAIEARDLTVILGGRKVLDIPEFAVKQNEVMVVVGPNGSGKSTLLLSLAKLLRPATGTIRYGGTEEGLSVLKLRRHFAVVFQEPYLLNRSVRDNVALGLRLRGVRGKEANDRVDRWLERFGVIHLARRPARALSGGEAKRVSLARAFALEPHTLFLDEPFNALDTPTRQGLLEDFENVLRETRMTTVMVTHDHNEALALADRVSVIMEGRIKQTGSPEEVFSSPADEEIAEFIETGNILHGTVEYSQSGIATIDVGEKGKIHAVSEVSSGTRVAIFIRYEDITLSVGAVDGVHSSARNQLKGIITRAFPLGAQLRITLDCGFLLSSLITRRSWEDMGLEIGKEVTASFKASAIHLIPKR